jgi:AraC-like DNA-binding protein
MVIPPHREGGQAQYTDQPLPSGESTSLAPVCGFGSAQSLRVHFTRIDQATPYRYRQAFDPA